MDYNSAIMEIVHLKRPELDLEGVYIALAINEVEQRIKNYCVRPEVPKALYFTWANMTLDLLDYEMAANNTHTTDDTISDGDINALIGSFGTISMGDSSWKEGTLNITNPTYRGLAAHTNNLDEIILNYREELNRFRRIW